jgi:hydroxymethylglutaryl-CoA synthase
LKTQQNPRDMSIFTTPSYIQSKVSVLLPEEKTGILGWGSYIPRWRIDLKEIADLWGFNPEQPEELAVLEKSVAGVDEDAVTMGWEAALNALKRAGINPGEIGAVWFGTESKPYAVKPSATIIAEALGITPKTMASDWEFACRAASEAIRVAIGAVASGLVKYALVIGSDTAQANPGDVLEFTASSAATALIIGPRDEAAAFFEASASFVTDTPDFWRRDHSRYPLHGEAFTGEPAYFKHIVGAVKLLFEKTGLKPEDFDYAVFHQPNGTFPIRVARMLGIPREKVLPGLVTPYIGNSYNSSALIGLSKILDEAKPGHRILLAPFGSGAGADAYSIVVTERVLERQGKALKVEDYLKRKHLISYAKYAKNRRLINRIV